MQMDLNCPYCSSQYQNSNPPRLLHCGHTFCHNCLQELIQLKQDKQTIICPEDQQQMNLSCSLNQLPKNIALMKIIQTRRKNNSNNSSTSMKDASFDLSKINREQECQDDDVAEQLISEINRASKDKEEERHKNVEENTAETSQNLKNLKIPAEQPQKKEEREVCLLHQRPIEVVCMNDYIRLCSKCALFGQHKSHDFKSLEQIQRENDKYYHQIIRMFEEKSTFMEKVVNKTVEKDLLELLKVKTSSIRKDINEKFKKLHEQLSKAQTIFINQLEQANKTIEKKLQSALELDKTIGAKYDNWEGKTLEAIKQSEKPTSEAHLTFYLKRSDIVNEGKELFSKLQQNQEEAYSYTVQVIEDFSVEFNDTDFEKIVNNLVQIIEHRKEQDLKRIQNLKLKENQATLANCNFLKIEKAPQLARQESEQSLLETYEFETHSFVDQSVGSKILEQSFVSVRDEHQTSHNSHNSTNQKDHSRALKRKTPVLNKEKLFLKEPTHIPQMTQNIKKKIKSLKLPEKYEKVVEGIMNDTLQIVDLTNAQLGDNTVIQILDLMKENLKVKTLKLIRNKLTDDGIAKMLPYFNNIISLNLSQNQLTENTIGILIDYKLKLPNLKTVILSQTKIVERKSKATIQRLKKLDVTVSV